MDTAGTDLYLQDLAWTGHKDSGIGVTLSPYGFNQFLKLKSYHIKDHPRQ